ncbi:MAG TPA: phosphate ABC transporter permease PstA [Thermoplasmata archaeon]|nr:phosphate ABC transporter permease PstA [Thermoplasmata archaeon]
MASHAARRAVNAIAFALTAGCVIVILIPLASLLYTAFANGGSVLSLHFLVGSPAVACTPGPGCNSGGIGPLLVGTLVLLALASAIAVPVGVFAGVYMSEFGGRGLGRTVSFFTDVMTGVPSIVVGVFVYQLLYLYDPRIVFSTISGSLALAVIMIPIVARTSEEGLRSVPTHVREAALGLGIPRYRTILSVVVPSAIPAVATGILLSVMRAGGEVAPLLFTAFGNLNGFVAFNQPVGALAPLIFDDGTSPFANLRAAAWGATLILVVLMLGISLLARLFLSNRVRVAGGG